MKPNRSDKYQYMFQELSFDIMPDITEYIAPDSPEEKELKLIKLDNIKRNLERIMFTGLTQNQYLIQSLYLKGYTQTEIAKKLGVNQSSVTKSLNGNCDYASAQNNNPTKYGGTRRKLKRLINNDFTFLYLMEQETMDDEAATPEVILKKLNTILNERIKQADEISILYVEIKKLNERLDKLNTTVNSLL